MNWRRKRGKISMCSVAVSAQLACSGLHGKILVC